MSGCIGPAAMTENNPPNSTYQAVLLNKNTTSLRGQITGVSNENGTGVRFNVNFYDLPDPAIYGPFSKIFISMIPLLTIADYLFYSLPCP